MVVVYLIGGLLLLVGGAELLVRGGSQLALAMRIPALIVGLTVVAGGTSAPELLVSVTAASAGSTDMALANVVGSNIANLTLVLGLASMVATVAIDPVLLRRDIPVAVGLQALVPILAWDGVLSRIDGAILLLVGLVYNGMLIHAARQGDAPDDEAPEAVERPWYLDAALLVAGITLLIVGAKAFVGGAEALALAAGLSERFVGLTVVALGTSSPEIATGMLSAFRGAGALAVGNSIGSNLFNGSLILGLTALIAPVVIHDGAAWIDLAAALAVTLLLLPIGWYGSLTRAGGATMVVGYLAYVAWGLFG